MFSRVLLVPHRIVMMGLLALMALGSSARAEHSDIVFHYADGKIVIEFGAEGQVFEGDFGDLPGGPHSTDDPGYATPSGQPITPHDIIGYNVVGPLLYHNGSGFAATAATVTVQDALGISDVPVTGATSSGSAWIGDADGGGVFHSHIDYAINASAPTGAYGILLTLSAYNDSFIPRADIADSEPFYIVLNRGLGGESFEGAVAAFAALIPEPTTGLMLAGLGGLAARRRRRFPR